MNGKHHVTEPSPFLRPATLLTAVLLSLAMLVSMGCGTRQHTAITSEAIPPEKKQVAALDEPQEVTPLIVAEESPSATDLQSMGRGSDPLLEASEKLEESQDPSSLQQDMLDEIKEIPDVSPMSRTDSPEDSTTSDPSQIASVAPVPLLAQPTDLTNLPRTLADIFFDFDQHNIRGDAITVLETNAKVLIARYPDRQVLIQGHCDERGTEEYNFVLGERRAQSIKSYLMDLGVPEKNLEVISYGKAKPACIDHRPDCWQQNRRGHLVIQ